jgi:hypothetical protein
MVVTEEDRVTLLTRAEASRIAIVSAGITYSKQRRWLRRSMADPGKFDEPTPGPIARRTAAEAPLEDGSSPDQIQKNKNPKTHSELLLPCPGGFFEN